jgi:hypothetical protein
MRLFSAHETTNNQQKRKREAGAPFKERDRATVKEM